MDANTYPPGAFCWVDLGTTDLPGAKQFYGALFGWTLADVPAGESGTYTMATLDNKNVCGLYEMMPDQAAQGETPRWASYVRVEDVEASAAKATDLGGAVISPAFDVMDYGRMAVVKDPIGATVALWQPREHTGAQRINEPNTPCWNELLSNDLNSGVTFYRQLFGWGSKTMPGGDGPPVTLLSNGEHPVATTVEIQEEWGELSPFWMVYFAVDDCDEAVDRAKSHGGDLVAGPQDVPPIGRFATLRDPQGALFSLIRLQNAG